MIETSERPLKEIRISNEINNKKTEISNWIFNRAKFFHEIGGEHILILPHPKHKVIDGMGIDEFLEGCPDILSVVIRDIYNERVMDRESGNWNTGIDLDNDFGFLLIAFV